MHFCGNLKTELSEFLPARRKSETKSCRNPFETSAWVGDILDMWK